MEAPHPSPCLALCLSFVRSHDIKKKKEKINMSLGGNIQTIADSHCIGLPSIVISFLLIEEIHYIFGHHESQHH
jgi:hypothetical protein